MRRIALACAVLCGSLLVDAPPAAAAEAELTLEKIMSDPDWISRRPENPYWSDDGRTIYYQRKRQGSEIRDLYALDAASGAADSYALDSSLYHSSTNATVLVYNSNQVAFRRDEKDHRIYSL